MEVKNNYCLYDCEIKLYQDKALSPSFVSFSQHKTDEFFKEYDPPTLFEYQYSKKEICDIKQVLKNNSLEASRGGITDGINLSIASFCHVLNVLRLPKKAKDIYQFIVKFVTNKFTYFGIIIFYNIFSLIKFASIIFNIKI